METNENMKLEPTWIRRVWLASAREQAAARQVGDAIGALAADQRVLFVGADRGSLGCHLESMGGQWTQATLRDDAVSYLKAYALMEPELLSEAPLPYEDGSFDVVVLSRVLENMPDDQAMIEDVHRVLSDRGLLIVHVASAKRYALARRIRQALRLPPFSGRVRGGYSDRMLFEILKHGFDVEQVQSYSRFWVECAGAWAERMLLIAGQEGCEPTVRRLALLQVFGVIASFLDKLLCLTQGHHTVAKAHRRIWKPRVTPKLQDGRSIADAALNTKIGTAAPF